MIAEAASNAPIFKLARSVHAWMRFGIGLRVQNHLHGQNVFAISLE
jgi:hypothetical protein